MNTVSESQANWFQKLAIRSIASQQPSENNKYTRKFIEKFNPEAVKDALLTLAQAISPRVGVKPKVIDGQMFNTLLSQFQDDRKSIRVSGRDTQSFGVNISLPSAEGGQKRSLYLQFKEGIVQNKTIYKEYPSLGRSVKAYEMISKFEHRDGRIIKITQENYTKPIITPDNIDTWQEVVDEQGNKKIVHSNSLIPSI